MSSWRTLYILILWRYSSVLSSKAFIVLLFAFTSVIHLGLIFVFGWKKPVLLFVIDDTNEPSPSYRKVFFTNLHRHLWHNDKACMSTDLIRDTKKKDCVKQKTWVRRQQGILRRTFSSHQSSIKNLIKYLSCLHILKE